jgi:glutathione S-transferase
MNLLNSPGPNPRIVRMFLLEKGITIPFQEIDILEGQNRQNTYLDLNPAGQLPSLILDNGTCISETVVICEYLEEIFPDVPLIGSTVSEKALNRMWLRRIEQNITENLYNSFRYSVGLELFRNRVYCIPEAAQGLAAIVQERLAWLDRLMHRKIYICGDDFTLADIVLFCALDFGEGVGQQINNALININSWFSRMYTRDSAYASLHPEGAATGRKGV